MSRSSLLFLLVLPTLAACGGGGKKSPRTLPPPTLTSVHPTSGPSSGGTMLHLVGTGFMDNSPGQNVVLVGGSAATNVLPLSDMEITCLTPPGLPGQVAVSITNDHGSASLPGVFLYEPTLYAATGANGSSGNLYTIDPTSGAATLVGPIGYSLTGLAHDTSGTLYGVTSAKAGPPYHLVTVDKATGAGTLVGDLVDGMGADVSVADVTFVGTRLIGWGSKTGAGSAAGAVEIDPNTAVVTVLGGPVGGAEIGHGIAASGGILYLASEGNAGTLYTANPTTGAVTAGPTLSGGTNMDIGALAFQQGTLYAADLAPNGAASELVRIDTSTGMITDVGAMPTTVDALVSDLP